jgi:hypothetical protein
VVDAQQNHRLNELCLNDRTAYRYDRLTRENRGAFRHCPDIADKLKVLQIFEELLTEKALRALVMLSSKIQSKYYIIQRGDDSVFVYDGTHYEIVFAPEILRKDTREIGVKMKPSFIGALAAEYLDSKNIIRACRFAIIVSLLTRTKFGNLEKLMSRSELVQYVTERGIKLFG